MNKIFKTVWSAVRQATVCVNEVTQSARNGCNSRSKKSGRQKKINHSLSLIATLCFSFYSGNSFAISSILPEVVDFKIDHINLQGVNVHKIFNSVSLATPNTGTRDIVFYDYPVEGVTDLKSQYILRGKDTIWNTFVSRSGNKVTFTVDENVSVFFNANTQVISTFADNGAYGVLTNKGILTINGGTFGTNATGSGSIGTISNIGSGTLTIQGGSSSSRIEYNVYNGGTGTISNEGEGTLTISGGSGVDAYGMTIGSYGEGSYGSISNTGNGTLIIKGGSSSGASGIYMVSSYKGDSSIVNGKNGTIKIEGGSVQDAYGIYALSDLGYMYLVQGGSTKITNDGTLSLIGGTSYAIANLSSKESANSDPDYDNGILPESIILNNGKLYLDSKAIGSFNQILPCGSRFCEQGGEKPNQVITGGGQVVNSSTGRVFAEAGALFEGEYSEPTENTVLKDIFIYNGSTISTTTTDGFVAEGGFAQSGSLTLKDDWKNHSIWEDGGEITFTDVADNTALADSIRSQFESAFGTGTTIHFTGTGTGTGGGTTVSSEFTEPVVNALVNEGKFVDGNVITSEILQAEDKSLVIGNAGTTAWEKWNAVGFEGIVGASSINVSGGRKLTLAGDAASMAVALRAVETGATTVIADSDITLSNGTLELGIAGLSATQGRIESTVTADANSELNVANGIFAINALKGEGTATIAKGSELTVTDLSIAKVSNSGGLIFESDRVTGVLTNENDQNATIQAGDITLATGAQIQNGKGGTVTAGHVITEGASKLINFTDATITVSSLEMNGTLLNNGTINIGEALTLAQGSTTTLSGTVHAGKLSVGAETEASKAMLAVASTYAAPQTSLTVEGDTYVDELELVSGNVDVADGATLAGQTLTDGHIGSSVTVAAGGTFAFSFTESGLKEAFEGIKVSTDGKAVAVLSTSLTFADGGALTVGNAMGSGTLNLGSDSLLLYTGKAMEADGTVKLTVDEGAQAIFTLEEGWGRYYLMTGLDEESITEAGKLVILDAEGNHVNADVGEKGLYVQVGSNNILDKDKDYGFASNINSLLDGGQDTASKLADVGYLSQAIIAKDGASQSNRLASLTAYAGVMAESARLASRTHDMALSHTLESPADGLWVRMLAGFAKTDGFTAGSGTAGYDADTYGIAVGGDLRIGKASTLGAAFHHADSDIESVDGATTSDMYEWGATLYAGHVFESGLRLSAALGYGKGSGDVNQQNLSAVSADVDADVWTAGMRLAYPMTAARTVITPYVGFDAVRIEQDAFTAKLAGANAFEFESVDGTYYRLPIGVRLDYAKEISAKRTLAAFADLSVVPQFGDTEAEQTVRGVNTHVADTTRLSYADELVSELRLGGSMRFGAMAFDLTYGASLGDVRDLSHEFNLNAKILF